MKNAILAVFVVFYVLLAALIGAGWCAWWALGHVLRISALEAINTGNWLEDYARRA